jgi:phosphoglycolate phosphatase-like HAD superfamily hydrolase
MADSKAEQIGGISRRWALRAFAGTLTAVTLARHGEAQSAPSATPLASWSEGPAKQAVLNFVRATTDRASRDFVAPEDRIATFDQDGTLWVEHPLYTQAMFALERVHALAPQNPEWQNQEPFKAVLSNDMAAVAHFTEGDWAEIIFLTHSGMSQTVFAEIAGQWLATAKHPRFKRLYTELVYQPMIEVMDYLRVNGFKTYIVSGGGQDFMRVYSQRIYRIPPEQIVGSSLKTKYETKDGKPELLRLPKLFFNCNFDGKVIGIDLFIGKRRPYASFGNSTGDRQMLEWADAGDGARLKMLVYHDDPAREYAYGPAGGLPDAKVGTFDQSLMDEAKTRGWTVISMKNDWKRVFAFG